MRKRKAKGRQGKRKAGREKTRSMFRWPLGTLRWSLIESGSRISTVFIKSLTKTRGSSISNGRWKRITSFFWQNSNLTNMSIEKYKEVSKNRTEAWVTKVDFIGTKFNNTIEELQKCVPSIECHFLLLSNKHCYEELYLELSRRERVVTAICKLGKLGTSRPMSIYCQQYPCPAFIFSHIFRL